MAKMAVLLQFMPGQEAGNGLADVLFNTVNPSGRLALSIPTRENETLTTPEQWPGVLGGDGHTLQANFTERLAVGLRCEPRTVVLEELLCVPPPLAALRCDALPLAELIAGSAATRGAISIAGGMLCHLALGTLYCWGNFEAPAVADRRWWRLRSPRPLRRTERRAWRACGFALRGPAAGVLPPCSGPRGCELGEQCEQLRRQPDAPVETVPRGTIRTPASRHLEHAWALGGEVARRVL